MLRHVLIFSGLVVASVSAITLTGGEISPLSRSIGWATGPSEEPIKISKATMPQAQSVVALGRQVVLDADRSGHYQGNFRINGASVEAMVDTGATTVAINSSTARRAGIRLQASDFSYPIQTANGMTKAAVTTIRTLEIGRIVVNDVQAVVLDDKSLSGVLIGMSFLSRLKRFGSESGRLVMIQ